MLPSLPGVSATIAVAIAAVVELTALALALLRSRKLARAYRHQRRNGEPFFSSVEKAILALTPSTPLIAKWVRLELQLWTFAIAGWFMKPQPCTRGLSFSHHRDTGWSAIAAAIVLVMIIEAIVVHVLFASLGLRAVQVVALVLHVYGLFWILGDAHALRICRSVLDFTPSGPVLRITVGVRAELSIPLTAVESVQIGAPAVGRHVPAVVVLGSPNVRLIFSHNVTLRRLLGDEQVRELALQVDDPETFCSAIETRLRHDPLTVVR